MRHGRERPPYKPQQLLRLPESLQERRPKGHLARFISDTTGALELGAFDARDDKERPRNQSFRPDAMVKVPVYD